MTQAECAEERWGHWKKGQMTNHGMRQFDRLARWLAYGHSRRDVSVWEDVSLSRIQLLISQAKQELGESGSGATIARRWLDSRKIQQEEEYV